MEIRYLTVLYVPSWRLGLVQSDPERADISANVSRVRTMSRHAQQFITFVFRVFFAAFIYFKIFPLKPGRVFEQPRGHGQKPSPRLIFCWFNPRAGRGSLRELSHLHLSKQIRFSTAS